MVPLKKILGNKEKITMSYKKQKKYLLTSSFQEATNQQKTIITLATKQLIKEKSD